MLTTINGKQFNVAEQPAEYWKWIIQGCYNHEWSVYDKYLKPEHTFVDLGAWVGGHSLYASQVAKAVVAVEPDPVAFQILTHNITQLINRPTVYLMERAVSNTNGVVTLGSGLLGASTTRLNPSAGGGIGPWVEGQTFEVKTVTLHDLPVNDPLFIKMDVEGSEEQILKDIEFFAERKPTLYIELHSFWWTDAAETRKQFERVCGLYSFVKEVVGNSYILTNEHTS